MNDHSLGTFIKRVAFETKSRINSLTSDHFTIYIYIYIEVYSKTIIHLSVVESGGYLRTEPPSGEVNIHHYPPPLR